MTVLLTDATSRPCSRGCPGPWQAAHAPVGPAAAEGVPPPFELAARLASEPAVRAPAQCEAGAMCAAARERRTARRASEARAGAGR